MKNIIITGGSRGIGRALVDKALKSGHRVFTIARNIQGLSTIQNSNFHYAPCDLSREEDIEKVFSEIPMGEVDVLINNAGLLLKKPFEQLNFEDFLQSMKVNYFAPAKIIQLLENQFSVEAHIVNISTIGAVQGSVKFPELSIYGGTKASLIHLTEILAEEWKDRALSVNCLALGAVQTEMLEEAFPGYVAPISAEEMAEYILDFALTQGKYYNGKILQVSRSTP